MKSDLWLWLLAGGTVVSGFFVLARASTRPLAVEPPSPSLVTFEPARSTPPEGGLTDLMVDVVHARNLFQPSRRPAPVSDPLAANLDTTRVSDAIGASLRLFGVIEGAVPSAIVEGLPGTSGPRVVWEGESIAGYLIRSVRLDGVEIVGADTTVVLTLPEEHS